MGSGASATSWTISREQADRVLREAFEGKDKRVNVEILMEIASKIRSKEQETTKESVDRDRTHKVATEESVERGHARDGKAEAIDIKEMTETVTRDKRGNKLSLGQQKVAKIRELFSMSDSNDDKVVRREEFVRAMSSMMNESDASSLFDEIDDSKTGRITMAKFLHYNVVTSINEMRRHFKAMDDDSNRQVTREEFFLFFVPTNSETTTSKLWSKLDTNSNGKVNFKEWKVWAEDVCAVKSLNDFFGGVFGVNKGA